MEMVDGEREEDFEFADSEELGAERVMEADGLGSDSRQMF